MGDLRDVYITGTGAFLPGEPVDNDRMEVAAANKVDADGVNLHFCDVSG